MKVLITGANCFIGKRLLMKLSMAGVESVSVIRHKSPLKEELDNLMNTSVLECSMEEYSTLDKHVLGIDAAVLLAWNGTRGSLRMDSSLQKANYEYNMKAIQSLIHAGCKTIITAGSQAEYGFYEGLISEDYECHPNTEYGKYKLKLYEDARATCEMCGVKLIEPRYFSLYGPNDYKDTLIMSLIRKMLKSEPCDLTECIQKWDYLYIDDAVDALYRLIVNDCEGGVYNVGSGDTRDLKEYVLEVKRILRSDSVLNFGAIPYPETGMVSICPDVCKLMDSISWKPQVTFEDGIRKIACSEMGGRNYE